MSCVHKLSVIAKVQPHVAYCTFIHGLVGKQTYFYTHFLMSLIFQPLESTIIKEFISAVIGRSGSSLERDLFALPV